MHELDPQYYKDLLLSIYPCKVPFSLAVKDDKPKRRLGTYYSANKRIILHCGKAVKDDPVETAIYEYAHHIHATEFDGDTRHQPPHGKEFWQIYGQLMCRARSLGFIRDTRDPVLVFREKVLAPAPLEAPAPEAPPCKEDKLPPNVSKALKEFFRGVYEYLNRE
jgi:hypothetical protein